MWWYWFLYLMTKLLIIGASYLCSYFISITLEKKMTQVAFFAKSLRFFIFFSLCYVFLPINFFLNINDDSSIRTFALSGILVTSFFLLDQIVKEVILRKLNNKLNLSHSNIQLLTILSRCLLVSIIGMMLLDAWGVSIAPLLASLGIGSLAVALALQPSLANLFSGLYLLLEKPLHVGDDVLLEQGHEGKIKKVGWRNTEIELFTGQVLTLPNTRLADSLLQNFSKPNAKIILTLTFQVNYQSSLEEVEELFLATSREAIKGMNLNIDEKTLSLRFTNFLPQVIEVKIFCQVTNRSELALVKHCLIKNIHQAAAQHHIELTSNSNAVDLSTLTLAHLKGMIDEQHTKANKT